MMILPNRRLYSARLRLSSVNPVTGMVLDLKLVIFVASKIYAATLLGILIGQRRR
jgi:hypothetical protein